MQSKSLLFNVILITLHGTEYNECIFLFLSVNFEKIYIIIIKQNILIGEISFTYLENVSVDWKIGVTK